MRQLTHHSTYTKTPMHFSMFLPSTASTTNKVPVRHVGCHPWLPVHPHGGWCLCRSCIGCLASRVRMRTSSPRPARSATPRHEAWRWYAQIPALAELASRARMTPTILGLVRGVLIHSPMVSCRAPRDTCSRDAMRSSGAGFFLNATQYPWSYNYHMYDYVREVGRCVRMLRWLPLHHGRGCYVCVATGASVAAGRTRCRHQPRVHFRPLDGRPWGADDWPQEPGWWRDPYVAWKCAVILTRALFCRGVLLLVRRRICLRRCQRLHLFVAPPAVIGGERRWAGISVTTRRRGRSMMQRN